MSDLITRLHELREALIEPDETTCMEAAAEIEKLRTQLVSVRNAGNQALREWKMYAESAEDDFEKSAEGSVYLACKALLTDDYPAGGESMEEAAANNFGLTVDDLDI